MIFYWLHIHLGILLSISEKDIEKNFEYNYFEKYFKIQEQFRENINFNELNGFGKWFVLFSLQEILKNYGSFLNILDINQENCDFYISNIYKYKEILDENQDFSKLLEKIKDLYDHNKNIIKEGNDKEWL